MPNAKRSSAEWIIEDSGGLLPDFGTVKFFNCYAMVESITQAVGFFDSSPVAGASLVAITMETSESIVMSLPSIISSSSPSSPDDSFTDTWYSAGP